MWYWKSEWPDQTIGWCGPYMSLMDVAADLGVDDVLEGMGEAAWLASITDPDNMPKMTIERR